MKILITGAAGFIGSNLVDRLLNHGNQILGIDNFDAFYDKKIKLTNLLKAQQEVNFKFSEIDIMDLDNLRQYFKENQIDVIIHLAAKAGVRPSIENPDTYFETNVMGTLNVLNCMKEFNIKKLIFASSSSVYGNNFKVPFSESDNVDFPISPYAASKKAAELLCHTYHHLFGFEIFCLRFFTVYGPRQRPDLAISKFIQNILDNQPITLFGAGNTKRDYTFIDDIIWGICSSINKLKGFEVINLGESQTISLIELVTEIEKAVGKKAIIEWKKMQQGDVFQTYADITKANLLLDYNPSTSIEAGLKKQLEWYLNEQNG